MPLLFVGELNPYGADPYFALYHLPRAASGNRLREILGLPDHLYAQLHKANLCTGRWSMRTARNEAASLELRSDVVVCLGAKVRTAFNGPPPFESVVRDGKTVVTLPHPSGLNRAWDAPDARSRARALMRSVAPQIPWGEP